MRLFHRFNPKERVTFLSFNSETEIITYRDAEGREKSLPMQSSIDMDFYITPGTEIGIQKGKMTNDTSSRQRGTRFYVFNGKSITYQAYVGWECISAISIPEPKISIGALHVLRNQFGIEETIAHLQDLKSGASTRQTGIQHRKLNFFLDKDVWKSEFRVGKWRMIANRVEFESELPLTIMAAVTGKSVSNLFDHPLFDGFEADIIDIEHKGEGYYIVNFEPLVFSPDEAMELMRNYRPSYQKAA